MNYIQKIAFRAEICKILSSIIKQDTDIPFAVFLVYHMFDEHYTSDVTEVLKEKVDPKIVDRMLMYIQSQIVPYDVWASKVYEDILNLEACNSYSDNMDIESMKMDLVRSVICNYINRVKEHSVYACYLLLNKILESDDLGYLHETAFYLKNNLPKLSVEEDLDTIPTETDNYRQFCEDSMIFSLSVFNTDILNVEEELAKEDEESVSSGTTELNEEQDDMLQEITACFADAKPNSFFCVKKKDIRTGEIVHFRSFSSITEVVNYLQIIFEENPNIQEDYIFTVNEVSGDEFDQP